MIRLLLITLLTLMSLASECQGQGVFVNLTPYGQDINCTSVNAGEGGPGYSFMANTCIDWNGGMGLKVSVFGLIATFQYYEDGNVHCTGEPTTSVAYKHGQCSLFNDSSLIQLPGQQQQQMGYVVMALDDTTNPKPPFNQNGLLITQYQPTDTLCAQPYLSYIYLANNTVLSSAPYTYTFYCSGEDSQPYETHCDQTTGDCTTKSLAQSCQATSSSTGYATQTC
ncbi:hypothetical protein SAMD00019534_059490 [Acytostelium subglobosum LB1]|uniref:hypothetical protein n=1 Tax=Acytostelium subglobosum LB1 TaxID=1410327 RepID=UPI000645221C|nr:hypothetical protein SAMD00019534_059490 [Acytostelium subglobosum LB1]GAM22774.1 hypothetical protein SAMD00019534_059490 [Acytostelium subglobosum LB1]|eukprot:XP_012754001.1 hypothetical protein SAMD00019534_059490 [Acytostelium subglobosum LB1]